MAKKSIPRAKAGTSKVSAEDKRHAFVEAFFANGQNALQAAITAGFSAKTAGVTGAKLLKDPRVSVVISKRRTELIASLELSTEKTILEVARIAFSDPRKITNKDGSFKRLHELDDDTAASVSSCKIDKDGVIEYKFWDKNSALEKAAKVQGLYEKDNDQKTPQVTIITRRVIG